MRTTVHHVLLVLLAVAAISRGQAGERHAPARIETPGLVLEMRHTVDRVETYRGRTLPWKEITEWRFTVRSVDSEGRLRVAAILTRVLGAKTGQDGESYRWDSADGR